MRIPYETWAPAETTRLRDEGNQLLTEAARLTDEASRRFAEAGVIEAALRSYMERAGASASPANGKPFPSDGAAARSGFDEKRAGPRSQAVLGALRRARPNALSRDAMIQAAASAGHPMTRDQLRSLIYLLKGAGRLVEEDGDRWRLVDGDESDGGDLPSHEGGHVASEEHAASASTADGSTRAAE